MPGKPRTEFEGAFYHIITRGNQRQKIFKDAADYQKFIQFLTSYKNRCHYFLKGRLIGWPRPSAVSCP